MECIKAQEKSPPLQPADSEAGRLETIVLLPEKRGYYVRKQL
jgi:hypothetical protein